MEKQRSEVVSGVNVDQTVLAGLRDWIAPNHSR